MTIRITLAARETIDRFFGVYATPEVARARVEALTQRVPIMYGILCINIIALAYTHLRSNPAWQAILLPGLFILIALSRCRSWATLRPAGMADREIQRTLRTIASVGPLIAAMLLIWALTLRSSPHLPTRSGVMTDQGHAVFFVGVTIVSCVFLLMHHRAAAISVGVTAMVPFVILLCSSCRPVETAIGLNVLVVTLGMIYVAMKFSHHFDASVIAASELLEMSALNARFAASDALTALPNRREFFSQLQHSEQSQEEFAVVVCDLDGFKQVNDLYGHHVGDELLRDVATRLLAAAPEARCVARMGGDEFACLLVGEHTVSAQSVAERMIAACGEPLAAPAFTIQIGASAGVCVSSAVRPDGPSLAYERADYALFAAKKAGRNRVELFSFAHDQSIRRESTIGHLLGSADLAKEIVPAFQPVVDAATHEIRAFEALARWVSPELGLVNPQEFIAVAERTDRILAITRQMLRAALKCASSWPDPVKVKVNLSVRDLMSTDQIEALIAELEHSGVRPSRLTLEVTETIFAESMERIRANVGVLRQSGCRVAIDDFGVGYSSLNYIHMLAPDVIKIDRCFINDITSDNSARRIVRTIVELARNVGALTVAEGVETAEQARCLQELGCDELQGYLFSRPVSAEQSARMAWRGTIECNEKAPERAIAAAL